MTVTYLEDAQAGSLSKAGNVTKPTKVGFFICGGAMFRPIFNPFMAAVAASLGNGDNLKRVYRPRIKGSVSFGSMPRKPNPKYPRAHQGARECLRRRRQMNKQAENYPLAA